MRQRILASWALAAMLTGCADGPPAAPSEEYAPPAPAELARRVVADRLGIEPGLVAITASSAVDFPDPSLGCPQPGMAYAQVITPGHKITATAEDKVFDVRVSGSRAMICEAAGRRPAKQRSY